MSDRGQADRRVAAVIASSVIIGSIDRGLGHVWRASRHSVAVAAVTRLSARWRDSGVARQRWFTGVALLTASAIHMTLTMVTDPPAGWLWLLVPVFTAASGAVIASAAGPGSTPE